MSELDKHSSGVVEPVEEQDNAQALAAEREERLISEYRKQLRAQQHPRLDRLFTWITEHGSLLTTVLYYTSILFAAQSALRTLLMLLFSNPNLAMPSAWMLLPLPLPILLLVFGNLVPTFAFQREKRVTLSALLGICGFGLVRYLYVILYSVLVPLILGMVKNPLITEHLVWSVCWFWLLLLTSAFGVWLFFTVKDVFLTNLDWLYDFRLDEQLDLRENKNSSYDVTFLKNTETGNAWSIREKDRFLHILINGSTGTGKSALICENMVNGDLERRVQNEDMLHTELETMLENREGALVHSFANEADFKPSYFLPAAGFEDKFLYLQQKYRGCGYTIIAPDASLNDKVYKTCKKLGIKVNRIEPKFRDNGKYAEDWTGFNPLYISPTIPTWKRKHEIVKRASLIAEILGSINEMSGRPDPYFTTVNRGLIINILKIMLCTFSEIPQNKGKVPTLLDMQAILSRFDLIKPYLLAIKSHPDCADYQDAIDFVELEMLSPAEGAGKIKKLWDQGRGIRMIVNDFLSNYMFRDVLCSQETMDIDQALANSEVTLVNYCLELSQGHAVSFASFFISCFIDAAYRRPGNENTRVPHVMMIDEFPLVIRPSFESAIVLLRKFRVSLVLCVQSLAQFEKSETTKYLEKVIISNCATSLIFGRGSLEEMRLYSELAGIHEVIVEQKSTTQTSITDDDPNQSFGTRETPTKENVLEGSSIRNRKFRELTVFTVRNSSPVAPFPATTTFSKGVAVTRKKTHFLTYLDPALFEQEEEAIQEQEETLSNERPVPEPLFEEEALAVQRAKALEADLLALSEEDAVSVSEALDETATEDNEEFVL